MLGTQGNVVIRLVDFGLSTCSILIYSEQQNKNHSVQQQGKPSRLDSSRRVGSSWDKRQTVGRVIEVEKSSLTCCKKIRQQKENFQEKHSAHTQFVLNSIALVLLLSWQSVPQYVCHRNPFFIWVIIFMILAQTNKAQSLLLRSSSQQHHWL